MALEYESNPNLVGAIKAPLGVLGSDKNYRQVLYETIAEQVEGLGRRPNANYNVGEVVYPSSNLQYALTCTTEGTSDAADLDISDNTEGDTITDGTVTWKVVKRNYLGSDGALPIANGGTGATTAKQARANLGLGSVATLNTVPIANGGTGATTASNACANLGAVRKINDITPDNGVVLLGNIVDTGEGSNLSGYLSVGNANLQFRLDTVYVGPSGTITFNEPFSKYCVGVVFAFTYPDIAEPRAITIWDRSTTGFSYKCVAQVGSGATTIPANFTYLAIGY